MWKRDSCTIWYMIVESTIQIDVPPSTVWEVFTDAARWPEWTESVERVTPLDGDGISIGRRFEIKQPRFPKVVWQVTDVVPGVSWSWTAHGAGATTVASHE